MTSSNYIVTAAVMLVACHRVTPAPRRTGDVSTIVDAAVPTRPDIASLETDPAMSWNDPRMLTALASDCNATNPGFERSLDNPLSCYFEFVSQSCSFDPCSPGEYDPCRSDCGDRCEGCTATCRARCGQCHTGCRDEACRVGCARGCIACIHDCLAVRDRCATAVCAVRYAACSREKAIAFHRSGCARACARCTATCAGDDPPPNCIDTCLQRRSRCTEEQRSTCESMGADYGLRYLDAGVDAAP